MLKRAAIVLSTVACALLAQNAAAVLEYVHKDFLASYAIYGGYLDASVAPLPGDTKVAFHLTGAAARDMFDAIGPDLGNGCPDHPQVRVRNRDTLLCRYRPKDGYRCDFGFDLSTGLSIAGSVGGAICTQ